MTPFEILCVSTEVQRQNLLNHPLIVAGQTGAISRSVYREFLTQAYFHVRHTVPLLMLAGARVVDTHPWLHAAMAEYIEEELGHDVWILADLEDLGVSTESVHEQGPSDATRVMVSVAYDTISRGNPLGMLGMIHVLEGTSIAVATAAGKALRQSLGLGNRGLRYLLSHGQLDQEHVGFFEGLVNRLSQSEIEVVCDHARLFYGLYRAIFEAISENIPMEEAA